MTTVSEIIFSQISTLSKKELEKLVLKAAAKDLAFHDYLLVNYFDKEFNEVDLYEEAKNDINYLLFKRYKGFSPELKMANFLSECNKRLTLFSKSCKNKKYEADLVVYVLDSVLGSDSDAHLETCFTAFDYRVYLLLKRLITLVQSKLHEDYKIEYVPYINSLLTRIHSTSNHLDYVYALPPSIK